MRGRRRGLLWTLGAALVICTSAAGCLSTRNYPDAAQAQIPRELEKVTLPPYVIEPPDILLVDVLRTVPLPPYHIDTQDVLFISYLGPTRPNEPLGGTYYAVDPEGNILLGPSYGRVKVQGLTDTEAAQAIKEQLIKSGLKREDVNAAQVAVSPVQTRALQQIRGQHLVRLDGTINLGTYGDVLVAGRTLKEAQMAINEQLSHYLKDPEVTVDVYGYNSKIYYVIMDQGDAALQMIRLPVTGNETVLDALAQVNGLPALTSRYHVWVARPAPAGSGCRQVLPVDLPAIAQCADTATNYQVLPGDRVYVKVDPLVRVDQMLAKVFTPVERVFGGILLGNSTVLNLRSPANTNGTGNGGGF
jgi:polysaccharide export outer membrane protein